MKVEKGARLVGYTQSTLLYPWFRRPQLFTWRPDRGLLHVLNAGVTHTRLRPKRGHNVYRRLLPGPSQARQA